MDDEGLAVGIIALVLALAGLGLVLALPAGMSGTGLLFTNGTRPLTANWNAGAYNITASWFKGNIALGSLNISDWGTYINQPLLTSSNVNFGSVTLSGNLILGANTITTSNTSLIASLNADLLDSQHGSYYRNATNINAGTLSLTYIPTMDDAHIPNLETLSYGGAFATAQIPSLDASKITSGTFGTARLDLSALAQNIAFASTQTVDGIDISANINQAVLTTSSPTFVGLLGSPYMDCYGTDYGTVLNLDFEEGTGTTSFDKSPYGNDGTITGASWADGKFGKALSFDGINDSITVVDSPSLQCSEVTVSFWIKGNVSVQDSDGLFGKGNAYKMNYGFRQEVSSETIQFICWDVFVTTLMVPSSDDVLDNSWHFVVGTYQKPIGTIYVDGTISGTQSPDIDLPVAPYDMVFMYDSTYSTYRNALLDDVRVYNRALTADEVRTMWLSGQGKYSSSTIISDKFRILGTDLATDFSVINGFATATNGFVTKYMSGDYGLTWTQTMPTGVNGMMVTVYNSNAGILSSRWYIYTNGAWKYSALV